MQSAMLAHPTISWIINTDLYEASDYWYSTYSSPRDQTVLLAESQHHVIYSTNSSRALHDGIEDRLHVRGRTADNAEHLGRCRLMFQRLSQFCIALLDFLEQPNVLDSDHRLIREGF